MRKKLAFALIALVLPMLSIGQSDYHSTTRPTKEMFYGFCIDNSVLYPEVVWAQARLESGNFKTKSYTNTNNCLGIYDSKRHRYASFDHWTDCVIAYRDRVQYRYTGSTANAEEYLSWLIEIGYAEDKNYLSKIRTIMRKP